MRSAAESVKENGAIKVSGIKLGIHADCAPKNHLKGGLSNSQLFQKGRKNRIANGARILFFFFSDDLTYNKVPTFKVYDLVSFDICVHP